MANQVLVRYAGTGENLNIVASLADTERGLRRP